jgi:hypothetical protein
VEGIGETFHDPNSLPLPFFFIDPPPLPPPGKG